MLPITRVALFKHGVAYFERSGTVHGEELLQLDFKAGQMNDVLKSLTALDYDGGSFSAFVYDSEEPLERRLEEINLRIPDQGAIAPFLDRIKGARIELPRGDGMLQGAVVGIEFIERLIDNTRVREPQLALFADGGRLVRVPLLEVDELRFVDASVRRDLQALLDILFSGLRKDRKRVSFKTLGDGERRISLSYVVEAPVWKTSYRIILPADIGAGASPYTGPDADPDASPDAGDKALLQGWALVDNTSEDDWQGVSLTLVAGLPISFVHDLYTPRYRQRPEIRVETEAAVAPPVVEAGLMSALDEDFDATAGDELAELAPAVASMNAARSMRMAMAEPPRPMADAARSSVQVQTRTQEVGDLFAYEIEHPVDVPHGQSALVPILQTNADIERVALYNPEIRERNPMTAFRIRNDTGLTLEGGPLTVFEGNAYVGEAMLDTMRQGDERITPYSVELGITVKHDKQRRREAFHRSSKHGAYLYKHYRQFELTEYEFASRLPRNVTVFLDHAFLYDLREDTPEPIEITDRFWRFRVAVTAEKTTRFTVTEVSEQQESISIGRLAHHEVRNLVDKQLISAEAREALETIADRVEALTRLRERLTNNKAQLGRIEQGQDRLRKNLQALGNSTGEARLRDRYVSKLTDEEEQIEGLRAENTGLQQEVEQAQQAIEALIDALTL